VPSRASAPTSGWSQLRSRLDAEHLAVALVVISVAAIVPGGFNRFVFAKLALVAMALVALALAPRRGALNRPAAWLLGVFLALFAVDGLIAGTPLITLVGRAPRYEGLVTLALYAGCVVLGARLVGVNRDESVERTLLGSLALVALAVATLAVLESFGLRPLSSTSARAGSLLGNASDEGAAGVLLLGPLAVAAVGSRRALTQLGAGAAALVVVLSASRGALLGALSMALAAVVLLRSPVTRRVLAALTVAFVGVVFAVPASRDRVLERTPFSRATVTGRELLWQESAVLLSHHLLTGVGPDHFADQVGTERDRTWQRRVGSASPPDSPHSWPLQVAVDGGLPLLALAVAIAGLVLFRGLARTEQERSRGSPALATGMLLGVVGYGVTLLFHFTSPGTAPLAALYAGGLLSARAASAPGSPWRGRLLALIAGTLAVVLVAGAIAEIEVLSAVRAAAAGNDPAALSRFAAARDLRPWDVEVDVIEATVLAHLAERTGVAGLRDATPFLRDAVRALPEDPQVLVDAGAIDEAEGHYGAAADDFRRALRYDRDDPVVLLRLGVVLGEAGRFAPAIRAFRGAVEVQPRSLGAWSDLVIAYRQLGQFAQLARAERVVADLER
jgi:O-antigen ligase